MPLVIYPPGGGGGGGGGGAASELSNGPTPVARAAGDGGVGWALGLYDQNVPGWGALYGSNQELHYTNPLGNDITIGGLVRANNTLFVDPTYGNDPAALPDRTDFPYSTVAAAVAAAAAGDVVYLLPGSHNAGAADNFYKAGITIYVGPGARWLLDNTTANRATAWLHSTTAASTFAIVGPGEIVLSNSGSGSWNMPVVEGALRGGVFAQLSNAAGAINFTLDVRQMSVFPSGSVNVPSDMHAVVNISATDSSNSYTVVRVARLLGCSSIALTSARNHSHTWVGQLDINAGTFFALLRPGTGTHHASVDSLRDAYVTLVRTLPFSGTANVTVEVGAGTNIGRILDAGQGTSSACAFTFLFKSPGNCAAATAIQSPANLSANTRVRILGNVQINSRIQFANNSNLFHLTLGEGVRISTADPGVEWQASSSNKYVWLRNTVIDTTGAALNNLSGGAATVFCQGTPIFRTAISGTVNYVGATPTVDTNLNSVTNTSQF